MQKVIQYKLADFEGPLDLLLHLISKHKLNIYDIEITKLFEQYIAAIHQMPAEDLEVKAEFLEMASRLIHIKTVMLLPRQEENVEELKRELTGELLEYQLCKEIAEKLRRMDKGESTFVRAPTVIQSDETYQRFHKAGELLTAYLNAAGRVQRRLPPPQSAFSGIVEHRIVSVSARMLFVIRRLRRLRYDSLEEIYFACQDRPEMVATFLAVLELMKSGRIYLQEGGKLVLGRTGGITA